MKLKTESILFPVCPKVGTKVNVNPRVTNARAPVKSCAIQVNFNFT